MKNNFVAIFSTIFFSGLAFAGGPHEEPAPGSRSVLVEEEAPWVSEELKPKLKTIECKSEDPGDDKKKIAFSCKIVPKEVNGKLKADITLTQSQKAGEINEVAGAGITASFSEADGVKTFIPPYKNILREIQVGAESYVKVTKKNEKDFKKDEDKYIKLKITCQESN